MNTKKIEVLNKAIQMLENGFHYRWTSNDRCNCGVVAHATGAKVSEIYTDVYYCVNGTWKGRVQSGQCKVTGLPLGDVQQHFLNNGFTKQDIYYLEDLANPHILKRAGADLHRSSKQDLLKYLRAWVSILQEQDQKEQPKEVVKTVYIRVAVPASISEQAKELIGITETIAR